MSDAPGLALVGAALFGLVVFFVRGMHGVYREKGKDEAAVYEGGRFLMSLVAAAAAIDFLTLTGDESGAAYGGLLALLFAAVFRWSTPAAVAGALTGVLGVVALLVRLPAAMTCADGAAVPAGVLLVVVLCSMLVGCVAMLAMGRLEAKLSGPFRIGSPEKLLTMLNVPLGGYAAAELVTFTVLMFGVPVFSGYGDVGRWVIILVATVVIGLVAGYRPTIVTAFGGAAVVVVSAIGDSRWGTACSPARTGAFGPLLTYVVVFVVATLVIERLRRR
ncbi:hypothetical protein M3G50_01020 [Brachybacterium muris]|uniref:hypothetical protein n=1 Tax=Brachybacterium muris TaxID=219301 RepID=UPI0021A72C0D|nr:hypothetical protein [Brachybacterium muris]MCT1429350.1 hypothetical protein [Brachybacterium muris]